MAQQEKDPVTTNQHFSLGELIDCNVVGTAQATDADRNTTLQGWKITGGIGAAVFTIDADTGQISIAKPELLEFTKHLTR